MNIYTDGHILLLETEKEMIQILNHSDYKSYLEDMLARIGFEGDPAESYMAYLVNVIVCNNISALIADKLGAMINQGKQETFFSEAESVNEIKMNGILNLQEILSNIMVNRENILALHKKWSSHNGFADSGSADSEGVSKESNPSDSELKERIPIAELLSFTPSNVRKLKEALKEDLVAFQFAEKGKQNNQGRFELPIYLDEAHLSHNGIEYEEYLPKWASIRYLEMLSLIYDFFMRYYGLLENKGETSEDLMAALISLLDFRILPVPFGLQKSIAVGRATAGKCAFIDSPVESFSIPRSRIMVLQAKDALGLVPRLFLYEQ